MSTSIPPIHPMPPIPTPEAPPQRRTPLGTPCAPAWDDTHIAFVTSEEARLNHRVCGARLLSGRACLMHPTHENGRCPHHGGFPNTGAQPNNHNARVHGLYARVLQKCGPHCANWQHCPYASQAVLDLPEPDRPECPYETAQYEQALEDGQQRLAAKPNADPLDTHLVAAMALSQVMMTRAAAALSVQPLTTTDTTVHNNSIGERTKPNPALAAMLRFSSEFRRYLHLLTPASPTPSPAIPPAGAPAPVPTEAELRQTHTKLELDIFDKRQKRLDQLTRLMGKYRELQREATEQRKRSGAVQSKTREEITRLKEQLTALAQEFDSLISPMMIDIGLEKMPRATDMIATLFNPAS